MSEDNGKALVKEEEKAAAAQAAFTLEQRIIANAQAVSTATWALAGDLYEFHETGAWGLLGYDTLEEFLARPELGMSRSQFFRLTKVWRDLVVVRQIPVSTLEQLEPSKVHEVVPAIMRGDVKIEEALDDAKELGRRDLRTKYNPEKATADDKKVVGDDNPLTGEDASLDSRDRVQCEHCGSWVDAAAIEGTSTEEIIRGDEFEEAVAKGPLVYDEEPVLASETPPAGEVFTTSSTAVTAPEPTDPEDVSAAEVGMKIEDAPVGDQTGVVFGLDEVVETGVVDSTAVDVTPGATPIDVHALTMPELNAVLENDTALFPEADRVEKPAVIRELQVRATKKGTVEGEQAVDVLCLHDLPLKPEPKQLHAR